MDIPEKDRDRAGEACYLAWRRIHKNLGPWHAIDDCRKEIYRVMAEAVIREMDQRPVTARVVRIERHDDIAS